MNLSLHSFTNSTINWHFVFLFFVNSYQRSPITNIHFDCNCSVLRSVRTWRRTPSIMLSFMLEWPFCIRRNGFWSSNFARQISDSTHVCNYSIEWKKSKRTTPKTKMCAAFHFVLNVIRCAPNTQCFFLRHSMFELYICMPFTVAHGHAHMSAAQKRCSFFCIYFSPFHHWMSESIYEQTGRPAWCLLHAPFNKCTSI